MLNKFVKENPYLTTFLILVVLFVVRYYFTVSIMKKQVEKEVNNQINGSNG